MADSYQSLISSITLMFQIHMSSGNYISSCSLGGLNHGLAKCAAQRPALAIYSWAALQSGLQSRLYPEIFGVVATKAIVILLLVFLFVKGGCYLLGIQGSNPTVDLLAYGGYKFVWYVVVASSSIKLTAFCRVIGTLLVGLVELSRTLYTIGFIYTSLANAFFLMRTMCIPLRSHISLLTSVTALCRSSRCNTRGCWHCLSCTTFSAYHVSLSCRCRADRVLVLV